MQKCITAKKYNRFTKYLYHPQNFWHLKQVLKNTNSQLTQNAKKYLRKKQNHISNQIIND